MKNEKLLNKWLLGQLSAEEEKLLKESSEFAEMVRIWDGLEVATPPKIDLQAELERFHASRKKRSRVISMDWPKRLIGIAASIVIVSIIGYFIATSLNDPMVVVTESLNEVYLPDSSIVTLNKGSVLTYSEKEWSSSRKVSLKGEGFFKVNSGSSFVVANEYGNVEVLGTSFNVKGRPHIFEVVCYEGRVAVTTAGQKQELHAGDGFINTESDQSRFRVHSTDVPSWIGGTSSFYRTPYLAVLKELENQFDISIETSRVDLKSTFTGSFPNNNLTLALEAVTTPSGYTYRLNNDRALIVGDAR